LLEPTTGTHSHPDLALSFMFPTNITYHVCAAVKTWNQLPEMSLLSVGFPWEDMSRFCSTYYALFMKYNRNAIYWGHFCPSVRPSVLQYEHLNYLYINATFGEGCTLLSFSLYNFPLPFPLLTLLLMLPLMVGNQVSHSYATMLEAFETLLLLSPLFLLVLLSKFYVAVVWNVANRRIGNFCNETV
jgi:hypothetical protein